MAKNTASETATGGRGGTLFFFILIAVMVVWVTQNVQIQTEGNNHTLVWVHHSNGGFLGNLLKSEEEVSDTTVLTTLEQIDSAGYDVKIGSVETVTKPEFILLCNLLAREYGADSVERKEKARVIETVFNRIRSEEFPNTVQAVIEQPNQFVGALSMYGYSERVTESVRLSVLEYLNGKYHSHPESLYYWGDGKKNHFYHEYEDFRHSYYDVFLPYGITP